MPRTRSRRAAPVLLLLLAPVAAGCLGESEAPAAVPSSSGAPDGTRAALVPWWDVGEYWVIDVERAGGAKTTYRLANFWNDSGTNHFWLGDSDRAKALDHALHDTNPFLGRIHHDILAPHERGMHAIMYKFPLVAGLRWEGGLLDGDWTSQVFEGPRSGTYLVKGVAADGARISYDYEPANRWFSTLKITDKAGKPALRATVTDHGYGATGTYWFLRGIDAYDGPQRRDGTHDETFTIKEEGLSGIALEMNLRSGAPFTVELRDPTGAVRAREAVTSPTGGALTRTREMAGAPQGEWTVRYVGTGTLEGEISVTGIIEVKSTI